jgi:FkbM family methyltransferase
LSLLSTFRFLMTHPLGARHPLATVARFARWQVASRLRREVEVEWVEGSKLVARNGMAGATGNIYCGLHEFADMGFVLHLLRPDDLFVDVGANVGSYTVLASAVCGARSIAIEPDPETMRSLLRNVQINSIGDRVRTIEAAAAARRGNVQLTVGLDATNRVVADWPAARQVRAETLDAILGASDPTLIKIDVEGYEHQVISGALETVRKPGLLALLVESVDATTQARLEAAGFCRANYSPFERRLSDAGQVTGAKHSNALFVRDLAACRQRLAAAKPRLVFGLAV